MNAVSWVAATIGVVLIVHAVVRWRNPIRCLCGGPFYTSTSGRRVCGRCGRPE